MKIKYFVFALAAGSMLLSCEKKDIQYTNNNDVDPSMAMFQVTRVVPEGDYSTGAANNRFYRMTIDDVDMWGDDYILWARMGTVPSTTRYYTVKGGTHTMKCYYKPGDEYVLGYDQNFTLEAGKKYCLFIYDYNQPPMIVDNSDPRIYFPDTGKADVAYSDDPNDPSNASRFQTIRFINLMYEEPGVPCDYKLQYMYQDPYDLQWYEVGEPVGFGEITDWAKIRINAYAPERSGQSGTGSNRNDADNRTGKVVSNGTCRIYYKAYIIHDDGTSEELKYSTNSGSSFSTYKDYWTATTGTRRFHVMRGCRVASGNNSYDGMWITEIAKY